MNKYPKEKASVVTKAFNHYKESLSTSTL